MLGMFLGGIPEAAVSAAMLTRAGYKPKMIFALWSTVLIAGMVAAAVGKQFISSESDAAVFFEAIAGGAVLALVSHAMIPEAIHEGGSLVVLPTVAGFLFSLFLAMYSAFVRCPTSLLNFPHAPRGHAAQVADVGGLDGFEQFTIKFFCITKQCFLVDEETHRSIRQ